MASLVVLAHFGVATWQEAGNLGVQVFFALSGWLIGTILIEMSDKRLDLFYFNRATRIWLPYLLALTLLYGCSLFRDPIDGRWFEFLTYDATFTHNWFSLLPKPDIAFAQMPLKGTGNHFWSLAVEEQFYLAAPLIILFLPFGRSPWLWAAIGLVVTALATNYGAISFGVTAAAARHLHPKLFADRKLNGAAAILALLAAPLLAMPETYRYAVPFFSIAVVLALAVPGPRAPLGRFAGGISFPLYLNGWIADFVAHGIAKRFNVDFPVAVGLLAYGGAILIAIAAFLAVDKPVLSYRRAWFSPTRGRALAVAAYALVGVGTVVGVALHGV